MQTQYYAGWDGGGTKTAFALFNENKEMLEYKEQEEIDENEVEIVKKLKKVIILVI